MQHLTEHLHACHKCNIMWQSNVAKGKNIDTLKVFFGCSVALFLPVFCLVILFLLLFVACRFRCLWQDLTASKTNTPPFKLCNKLELYQYEGRLTEWLNVELRDLSRYFYVSIFPLSLALHQKLRDAWNIYRTSNIFLSSALARLPIEMQHW